MYGRIPESIHGNTLEDETNKAGNEAGHEEGAHAPDGPAEIFAGEDAPVEEEDAELDDGF